MGLLVRAEMSAMKLVGGICWQKDDEGERFDGLLQVELPSIGVGVGLEGTFGKVYDDMSTPETNEGFRYWRVDAQVKFWRYWYSPFRRYIPVCIRGRILAPYGNGYEYSAQCKINI